MKKAIIVTLGLFVLALVFAQGCNKNAGKGKVNYAKPFEPPTRTAYIPLPPGAIEPEGWLRDWCLAARDGYTNHMEDVDVAFKQAWAADFKQTGEKLAWPKGGWPYEGGGYWFEGLTRLGYALHDEAMINHVKECLYAVINNMNEKGISFLWWLDRNNPSDVKDAYQEGEWPLWANGLFGRALATYCLASKDQRAIDALVAGYTGNPEWLWKGGTINCWPAFQAYTLTGNEKIKEALTKVFTQQFEEKPDLTWIRYKRMPNETPGAEKNDHGVVFLETSTPWALGYLWTGNREFFDAPLAWHALVERECLQPYGVIVVDEFYGPTGAFRSTETCDVAGFIWSKLFFLTIGGDGTMADKVERAFFNAQPATVSRDYTTHVYFQSPNRMKDQSLPPAKQCTYNKTHYPLCCTAALNRPLPYYVTNMWMATYDNGLAAMLYGPCKVSALVADAVPVELICKTDYPFNESIEVSIKPERETNFPLSFRIPNWCKQATIAVNGASIAATPEDKGFVRIERTWKPGDTVTLQFPMAVQVAIGLDKNVKPAAPYASVSYGPILFALPIPETKDANTPDPKAKWNYALDAEGENMGSDITVERTAIPEKWNWSLASPLKLHANAVSFPWRPDAKTPLPSKPVDSKSKPEKVTLVPYGCTKFRVSMMPLTAKTFKLAEKEEKR